MTLSGTRTVTIGLGAALVASLLTLVGAPAPARAVQTATSGFTTVLYDDFNGTALDQAKWSTRLDNTIDGTRYCAVPMPANSIVANGKFAAKVSKTAKALQKTRLARAKAAQKANGKKATGCKYGLYDYSMMSSQDKITVSSYGQLTASVKFALGQGFHGGMWLRSITPDLEIDAVEAFGYGYGVTNFFYVGKTRYQSGSGKVLKSAVKKKSWWSRYHTVNLTWVPNASGQTVFTYKIDGQVTWTTAKTLPAANYFLVVSNIVSNWEMKYLKKPTKGAKGVKKAKMPQSMVVDWIQLDQYTG